MTAIALVFSIFQLNPSPFCMLDEVDAPLDDANVGRYANLVKEMSKSVQFIFITHNKITMEMANQLLGVTMHEPNVSGSLRLTLKKPLSLQPCSDSTIIILFSDDGMAPPLLTRINAKYF